MFTAPQSVHFVGICGTAMASAAAALQARGFEVTGSDENVYPPMSTFLSERNMRVFTGYKESNLDHNPSLVVIGNAMSRGNPEVEVVLERKLQYVSLPELLKEFFIRGKRSLVVAGTHGKTTTTSLLAWVFEHSGRKPSFLIGGIPTNLGEGARFTDSEWFIIEGDEYDTAFFDKRSKFVHYLPEVALLNNLEFDHADIFENLAAIQTSFRRLINLVPRNGLVLANGDDANLAPLLGVRHSPVRTFGLGANCQARAEALDLQADRSGFVLNGEPYEIPMVGELNVRNALGVAAAALHCGITPNEIRAAFKTFLGIKRRMELRGEPAGVAVVDDFGHHPTAIRETVAALRLRFPNRRLWAVFEPRSNTTRRNIFQTELGEALATADAVVVAQVARLEMLAPGERLDPERLMREINAAGRPASYLANPDLIASHLGENAVQGDVICIFSNGGFGGLHDKLMRLLLAR